MTIAWQANTKQDFGTKSLTAEHDLGTSDLFTDEGLAYLIDAYPRESLDVWSFAPNCEGQTTSLRGRAPHMSGREIMEAVKTGRIWLNLRRASDDIDDLKPIAQEIFDGLQDASGTRITKRDMGLLISSPHVHVHYHLDIPMVALFQLRGEKNVWIYPTDESYASPEDIEGIVHMARVEDLPYQHGFDDAARLVKLKPGMAVTWPQLSPHRIQNENCVNVSLSCEFMTLKSAINANAIYTNSFLRKNLGLSPKAHNGMNPATFGKAAFARMHKAAVKRGPKIAATPVTFELDLSAEDHVRLLYA